MRALLLRRTAFVAVLVTGLGLTASGVHGLSGMNTSLELAAAPAERVAPVSARWDCDREQPPRRLV